MVQADTPGEASLGQKPEVGNSELVELDRCQLEMYDWLLAGLRQPTSFGTSCMTRVEPEREAWRAGDQGGRGLGNQDSGIVFRIWDLGKGEMIQR